MNVLTLGIHYEVSEMSLCWSEADNWLSSLNLLHSESLNLFQSDFNRLPPTAALCEQKPLVPHKSKGSLPSKVLARHLIEALVVRPVEVPQSPHHLRVDGGVRPPFRLPQAVRLAAALRLLQAGEAFCFVEVEVLVRDDPLETQKVLDLAQFSGRVGDEPLPADQMDLSPGEPGQPALQVLGVQADPQRAPQRVNLT